MKIDGYDTAYEVPVAGRMPVSQTGMQFVFEGNLWEIVGVYADGTLDVLDDSDESVQVIPAIYMGESGMLVPGNWQDMDTVHWIGPITLD